MPEPGSLNLEVVLALLVAALLVLGATALWVRIGAVRAERTHPPIGRFIEVDGVRLHYLDRGEGQAVLLLHGNGAMIEDWVASGVFDLLAQHFRVVAFDRPGFGYSARPRKRAWPPEAQADLLAAAFARIGLVQPVAVGHSWGTLVALALAVRHPGAVRGLVLLSGYYYPSLRLDAALLSPPALPVIGDVMRYTVSPLLGRLMQHRILRRMFAPRPVPTRFEQAFPCRLTLRPWQIRAAAEEAGLMVAAVAGLRHHYKQIRLPTAILAGTEDRIVDPQQAAALGRDIGDSQLRLIPHTGHMLHYAVPDQVLDAIARVAEQPASPASRRTV